MKFFLCDRTNKTHRKKNMSFLRPSTRQQPIVVTDQKIRELWADAARMECTEFARKGSNEYIRTKATFDKLLSDYKWTKMTISQRKWHVACKRCGVPFAKKGTPEYDLVMSQYKTVQDHEVGL